MEDVLTEIPPPSRFFLDDLNNFAIPSPSLPPPLLLLSPNPNPNPNPNLLILALSSPSITALCRLPSSHLAGTLILPELSLSGSPLNALPTSPLLSTPSAYLLSLPHPIPPPRSRAIAKTLLHQLKPVRVLIFDSIRSDNYRGRLSADDALIFKVETTKEREVENGNQLVGGGVEYLGPGSVLDGVGAAVLGECQMRGLRGALVGTWSGCGGSVGVARTIAKIVKRVGVEIPDSDFDGGKDSRYDSDLYT